MAIKDRKNIDVDVSEDNDSDTTTVEEPTTKRVEIVKGPDMRVAPPPNPADGTIRITVHRTPQHEDSHLFVCINGKEEYLEFDVPLDVHPSFYYAIKDAVQPVRVLQPNGTVTYRIRPLYSYTVHADKRTNKDKPL